MDTESLIEISGTDDHLSQEYAFNRENNRWELIRKPVTPLSLKQHVYSAFKSTFLPSGFPNSVRPEYLTYQFWDSLQGISSYLRSVLTTKAVLAGAGVGSAEATPLAAALTWVVRDGIGMVGSLAFAYKFADKFEVNVKEWRLLADVLNNAGLSLDLLSSVLPSKCYLPLIAMSTLSKSCCGLIAGATKAHISAHFSLGGHLADVTAKESTQETGVALLGLVIGMVCAGFIGNDIATTWIVFISLLVLHQWANFMLVRVLVLDTLNPQRIYLITLRLLKEGQKNFTLVSPNEIARSESLLRPIWLAFYGPQVGVPLNQLLDKVNWKLSLEECENGTYLIAQSKRSRQVFVCLNEICSYREILEAHFVANFLQQKEPSTSNSSGSMEDRSEWFLVDHKTIDEAKLWFREVVQEYFHGLMGNHWDIREGSSRLGTGKWRYKLPEAKKRN